MEQINIFDTDRDECVFCKIIRGEAKSYMVFEDDVSCAFLDHRPLLSGHCILVPREHYDTLLDIPPNLTGPLFSNTQLLARAVEKGLGAHGSFTAINTRISQSVPHFHIHIIPRWKKDGLFSHKIIWKRQPYKDEESMLKAQGKIKDAVDQLSK